MYSSTNVKTFQKVYKHPMWITSPQTWGRGYILPVEAWSQRHPRCFHVRIPGEFQECQNQRSHRIQMDRDEKLRENTHHVTGWSKSLGVWFGSSEFLQLDNVFQIKGAQESSLLFVRPEIRKDTKDLFAQQFFFPCPGQCAVLVRRPSVPNSGVLDSGKLCICGLIYV